ncbi:unnamed protein product, partial [marine sediment metagenome]
QQDIFSDVFSNQAMFVLNLNLTLAGIKQKICHLTTAELPD